MKTCKNYTFEILGGYLMNNNELNVEYFIHCVQITAENNKPTYDLLYSDKRKKSLNIALEWVLYFIDQELSFSGYKGYTATIKHLQAFEKEHTSLIIAIEQLTAYVNNKRELLKNQ